MNDTFSEVKIVSSSQENILPDSQGFDQILSELRHIVTQLELGNLPLEQALHMFEEGVRLSRKGAEILSTAEHRIELLVQAESESLSNSDL